MDADIERWLQAVEKRSKGWLNSGNCPPCDVFLNGEKLQNVLAISRRRGKVIQAVRPLRSDRKGGVITRQLFGDIRIELIEPEQTSAAEA